MLPTGAGERRYRTPEGLPREHQDVIFKPLDGMGGTAIFRVKTDDPNVSVILEMLTDHGRQTIMAQKFIPKFPRATSAY